MKIGMKDNPRLPRILGGMVVMGFVVVAGCRQPSALDNDLSSLCRSDGGGSEWTLVDSVILRESDSLFVARPTITFRVDQEGGIYVPDVGSNRLLVFEPSGSPSHALGQPGGGPGEFQRIGPFGYVDSQYVIQEDNGGRRLNIYRRATGSFIGAVRYTGHLSWVSSADSGGYLVGLIDPSLEATISILSRADLTNLEDGASVELEPSLAPPPDVYRKYPLLNAWVDAKAASNGNATIVAFGGTDFLTVNAEGRPHPDTIPIPICRRRGVKQDALDAHFRRSPRSAKEDRVSAETTTSAISALLGLWRLTDGSILVWQQDPTLESNGRILKGTAYVTVVTPDLRSACVDARFEAPGIGRANLSVHNDTLLVLDQVVPEESERSMTVVRKYVLNTSGCRWVRLAVK